MVLKCVVVAMWVLLMVVVGLSAASDAELPLGAFRCRHERCRHFSFSWSGYSVFYEVDGYRLMISHIEDSLTINCDGAPGLGSLALPSADPAATLSHVKLIHCPLPDKSLADIFTTLNVTFNITLINSNPDEDALRNRLTLLEPSPSPPLTAKHFTGLDHLIELNIDGNRLTTSATLERGFLAPLQNLRSLFIRGIALPAGELEALPSTFEKIYLEKTGGVDHLPKEIHSSLVLRRLTVSSDNAVDAVTVPPGIRVLYVKSPATTMRLNGAPSLESLYLANWTEVLPAPLERSDSLRWLHLIAPAMHALPDGWLKNCSRLKELVIEDARNLTTLPSRLFYGAKELIYISFAGGALESLPMGVLDQAPNLITLLLNGNRLRTLPSVTFAVAQKVQVLDLSSNELETSAVDALAPLQDLDYLDLANNTWLGDVCEPDGDSLIREATKLRRLILSGTAVTHICRDWRENVTLEWDQNDKPNLAV